MSKIILTIEADGAGDLLSSVSALAVALAGGAPAATTTKAAPTSEAPPAGETAAQKKAREKKEAEAEAAAKAAAEEAEAQALLAGDEGGTETELTAADLSEAMKAALAKTTAANCLAAIKSTAGVSRVGDVKPEQYQAVFDALTALAA